MESIAVTWAPQGSFHHVGFVVASIAQTIEGFRKSLEAHWDGIVIDDPAQKVRVTFLESANAVDPLFELIEPAAANSPVAAAAKKGGGLHHVCYVVDSMDEQLASCLEQRAIIVRRPAAAVAFGGRKIAWVYTRNKLLIEYLER